MAFQLATVIASHARAEVAQAQVIVIATTAQATPIARRLQQEIEALGFSVLVEGQAWLERPEQELAARNAVAAIEVVTGSPGYIALHVLEPKTARIIQQVLPIEAPNDPTATELVTTRAVELLRAARLDVGTARPRMESAPKLAAPTQATSQPPPKVIPQLWLGAGPGLSYSPHWRTSANLEATATYIGKMGLGWIGAITGPLASSKLVVPNIGTIEATSITFRIGGAFQALRAVPLGLRFGSGMEWSQLRFTGQVGAPYEGSSAYLSLIAPWAATSSTIRLSPHLQLVTQFGTSWGLRRTVVRVVGQELRDWGRPTVSGAITLEWQTL